MWRGVRVSEQSDSGRWAENDTWVRDRAFTIGAIVNSCARAPDGNLVALERTGPAHRMRTAETLLKASLTARSVGIALLPRVFPRGPTSWPKSHANRTWVSEQAQVLELNSPSYGFDSHHPLQTPRQPMRAIANDSCDDEER